MAVIRFGILGLIFSLGVQSAFADELRVVDVRRNITMADTDPVYKDFYINGGEGDGLKKNLVVTAVRKIQVRDASGAQSYGEILVPVGQLRVIATYGKIAVAREYKLLPREDLPMLEQTGLMSGDKIDLKGAFVDASKPKPAGKDVVSHKAKKAQSVAALKLKVKPLANKAANGGSRAPASVTDTPKANAKPAKAPDAEVAPSSASQAAAATETKKN